VLHDLAKLYRQQGKEEEAALIHQNHVIR